MATRWLQQFLFAGFKNASATGKSTKQITAEIQTLNSSYMNELSQDPTKRRTTGFSEHPESFLD